MGVAILWVILFHCISFYELIPSSNLLPFFCRIGYGGVDIFLLLSGFGLYYASLKKESIGRFYFKRFIRIMPTFIIVLMVEHLLKGDFSILAYFMDVTTINFWMEKDYTFWYIPCIAMFYLIFPLYIKLFNKSPYIITLIAIIIGITLSLTYVDFGENRIKLVLLFFIRIPIFSVGVLAGKLSLDKDFSYPSLRNMLYLLTLIGVGILYAVFNIPYLKGMSWDGLLWYPFMLITPGLVLFLANLFDRFSRVKGLQMIFGFLGAISLELYLIHQLFFSNISLLYNALGLDFKYVLLLIVAFSVLLSFLLNRLLEKALPSSRKVGTSKKGAKG